MNLLRSQSWALKKNCQLFLEWWELIDVGSNLEIKTAFDSDDTRSKPKLPEWSEVLWNHWHLRPLLGSCYWDLRMGCLKGLQNTSFGRWLRENRWWRWSNGEQQRWNLGVGADGTNQRVSHSSMLPSITVKVTVLAVKKQLLCFHWFHILILKYKVYHLSFRNPFSNFYDLKITYINIFQMYKFLTKYDEYLLRNYGLRFFKWCIPVKKSRLNGPKAFVFLGNILI